MASAGALASWTACLMNMHHGELLSIVNLQGVSEQVAECFHPVATCALPLTPAALPLRHAFAGASHPSPACSVQWQRSPVTVAFQNASLSVSTGGTCFRSKEGLSRNVCGRRSCRRLWTRLGGSSAHRLLPSLRLSHPSSPPGLQSGLPRPLPHHRVAAALAAEAGARSRKRAAARGRPLWWLCPSKVREQEPRAAAGHAVPLGPLRRPWLGKPQRCPPACSHHDNRIFIAIATLKQAHCLSRLYQSRHPQPPKLPVGRPQLQTPSCPLQGPRRQCRWQCRIYMAYRRRPCG